jgi:hypothetical protein
MRRQKKCDDDLFDKLDRAQRHDRVEERLAEAEEKQICEKYE